MTPEERWSRIEENLRRIDESIKRISQDVHATREERPPDRAAGQAGRDLHVALLNAAAALQHLGDLRLALLSAATAISQGLGRPPEAG